MLSTSCNRALFIGIAVDSLKAHRRTWGQYMACESRPNSPKRVENTLVRTKTHYRSADL